MDEFLKIAVRVIGAILFIVLIVVFLLPLIVVFLLLLVIQTVFHVKFLNTHWIHPTFDYSQLRHHRKHARQADSGAEVPASQDVIDAEAVELPEDDNKNE